MASDHYEDRCPSCGGHFTQGCYADCPKRTTPELRAEIERLTAALATARRDALEEAAKLAKVAWLKTRYGSIADADAMNGMCEELSAAIRALKEET